MRPAVPRSERAEPSVVPLAETCLGYLAENPEELLAFMQHAGLDPEALRRSVSSAPFQRGLIDYFASNEPILLALCANSGTSPEQFMRVWHRLNATE
jgi:hypothetical protein